MTDVGEDKVRSVPVNYLETKNLSKYGKQMAKA
jgi:hypothetical protein